MGFFQKQICSVHSLFSMLPTAFSFLGHCNVAQRFPGVVHHTGHSKWKRSTTEMSFLIDCSMLCLIQPFLEVSKHHLICPCRLLTSEYFSRWIVVLYSPVLLSLSFLLSTAWNVLTGLRGVIGHVAVRKKYTECLRADLWALLLCWN